MWCRQGRLLSLVERAVGGAGAGLVRPDCWFVSLNPAGSTHQSTDRNTALQHFAMGDKADRGYLVTVTSSCCTDSRYQSLVLENTH